MLFVVLATLVAERSKETLEEMRRLKARPGILVKGVYALYGRHDVLMIFESESENSALDFVLELRNRSHLSRRIREFRPTFVTMRWKL